MSRKQWWPLQASFYDSQKSIIDFQKKARDNKWLKSKEATKIFHIYAMHDVINSEHLTDVNTYMQISKYDNHMKNSGRLSIIRLLSMLLKWYGALGKYKTLTHPPSVFIIPNLFHKNFYYGIIATLNPDENHINKKPLTIIISEIDIVPHHLDISKTHWFGKHWVVPQGPDSYQWLTTKLWESEQKKPSFAKWAYNSYIEKRTWLENQVSNNKINDYSISGLLYFSFNMDDKEHKDNNLRKIQALKEMGAIYIAKTKSWYLPEFWDKNAVYEWLNIAKNLDIYNVNYKANYSKNINYKKAKNNNNT